MNSQQTRPPLRGGQLSAEKLMELAEAAQTALSEFMTAVKARQLAREGPQLTQELHQVAPRFAARRGAMSQPTMGKTTTEYECPECGGEMKKRASIYGAFLSCAAYPTCTGKRKADGRLIGTQPNAWVEQARER